MKIWLDLANSPQVLFFRPILDELERPGHQVEITTRVYAQTVQLADQFGFKHTVVGQHGGRQMSGLAVQISIARFDIGSLGSKPSFRSGPQSQLLQPVFSGCFFRHPRSDADGL